MAKSSHADTARCTLHELIPSRTYDLTLAAARKHFQTMLDINADLEEAKFARQNVKNIDDLLAKSRAN